MNISQKTNCSNKSINWGRDLFPITCKFSQKTNKGRKQWILLKEAILFLNPWIGAEIWPGPGVELGILLGVEPGMLFGLGIGIGMLIGLKIGDKLGLGLLIGLVIGIVIGIFNPEIIFRANKNQFLTILKL